MISNKAVLNNAWSLTVAATYTVLEGSHHQVLDISGITKILLAEVSSQNILA